MIKTECKQLSMQSDLKTCKKKKSLDGAKGSDFTAECY